jgi:membrane-associated protein
VSLILGLHGMVALVLLCSLLLVEEAGVPLPVPGELTLIAAGLLIGTGALDPWLFVPLAIVSCLAGSLTGYSWARLVGEHGLRAAAERLHQTERLEKVKARLRQAEPMQIALSRLMPLLRVNTTLVAGAAGVDRKRFLIAITPVTVLWVLVFTALGVVAGVPAEHFLGKLEGLILQGGVLIAIGAGGYLAIRRTPAGARAVMGRLPTNLRVVLAIAVDITLIATVVSGVLAIVAGVLAIVRPLLPIDAFAGWVELMASVVVIALFYSVATRRGLDATAGETLFGTSYLTRGAEQPARVRLRRMLRAALEQGKAAEPADLVRMAAVLRAVGDVRHLRIARLLLERERSLSELTSELELTPREVTDALGDLRAAGLVVERGDGDDRRYALADDHVRIGLAELLAHAASSAHADGFRK